MSYFSCDPLLGNQEECVFICIDEDITDQKYCNVFLYAKLKGTFSEVSIKIFLLYNSTEGGAAHMAKDPTGVICFLEHTEPSEFPFHW